MALAASGVFSEALAKAKKLVGQCTAWQTWTGDTGDETAATLHIAEYEKLWTEAEVAAGRDVRCMIRLAGARFVPGSAVLAGEIEVHFEAPVSAIYAADVEQAFREFNNNLAAVLAEMVQDSLDDVSGNLMFIRGGEMSGGEAFRTPESARETDDDVIWAEVRFPFGQKF